MWDEQKSDYLKCFTMPFGADASVQINDTQNTTMHLHPKDAMLLFTSIPTLPLASHKTKVTGINGALYIDYETDLATYRSWLPQYEMYETLAQEQKQLHKAYKAAQRAAAKKAQ